MNLSAGHHEDRLALADAVGNARCLAAALDDEVIGLPYGADVTLGARRTVGLWSDYLAMARARPITAQLKSPPVGLRASPDDKASLPES